MSILSIEGLSVSARVQDGTVRILDRVDLTVASGEILGVVGESGSGKTTVARAVVGLLQRNISVDSGSIFVSGRTVLKPGFDATSSIRGSQVGFVFQGAARSLNPLMRVRTHLREVLRRHEPDVSPTAIAERSREVLTRMHVDDADRVLGSYPHQLSGGLRQRVAIGLAIISRPAVVIADECTTALDVTTQAEVVRLLREIVDDLGVGLLFVTHDLFLAGDLCDRIAVMQGGEVVECGAVGSVMARPKTEYTRGLLAAVPGWSSA